MTDNPTQAAPAPWMRKFRKKPVVIEAWQHKAGEQPHEATEHVIAGTLRYCEDDTVLIKTLEGEMIGRPGDWIIRGIKGELYPCKPDIFAATYEPVALISAAAPSEGGDWVRVPREPTAAMVEAGRNANDRYATEIAPCSSFRASAAWEAMIAAAPFNDVQCPVCFYPSFERPSLSVAPPAPDADPRGGELGPVRYADTFNDTIGAARSPQPNAGVLTDSARVQAAAEEIADYVFDHLESPRESARDNMSSYFTAIIAKHLGAGAGLTSEDIAAIKTLCNSNPWWSSRRAELIYPDMTAEIEKVRQIINRLDTSHRLAPGGGE